VAKSLRRRVDIFTKAHWLVPRREDDDKGVPFIAKDIVCEQAEAEELAVTLNLIFKDEQRIE
jgi:hypothetical protein